MKKIAFIAALAFCLGLIGCGESDEVTNVTETTTNTTTTTTYSLEDDTEYYDNDEETEYENQSNPLTDYYDVLSKEYHDDNELVRITNIFDTHEINGVIYKYEFDNWNFLIDDHTYTSWEDVGFDCYLNTFDITAQKYNRIKLFSSNAFPDKVENYDDFVIFDNYLYVVKNDRLDISDNYSNYRTSLIKYDLSGKEIASCELGETEIYGAHGDIYDFLKIYFISNNGDVCIGQLNNNVNIIISSDFKHIDSVPTYDVPLEHGKTEERTPSIFAVYSDYIYADVSSENKEKIVIRYDITSKKWSDPLYTTDYRINEQMIEKYAYYKDSQMDCYVIFDIETGETVASINEAFTKYMTTNYEYRSNMPDEWAKFFKYGYTHIRVDGYWNEIRIYGDGSTSYDNNILVDLGYDDSKDNRVCVIDGEHYINDANYLRSFADGEKSEIEIEKI